MKVYQPCRDASRSSFFRGTGGEAGPGAGFPPPFRSGPVNDFRPPGATARTRRASGQVFFVAAWRFR